MNEKIINGDCIEEMKKMPDNSVDLIVTDPPYKVSQRYGAGVDADNLIAVSSIYHSLQEMSRILKPGKFCVVFYDNRILPVLFQAIRGTELVYRKQIFLYRRWGNANRWVGWMQCTDPICIFVNGSDKPFAPKIKGKVKHDCFIKASPEAETTGHPAQKPMELIKDIITWCSDENDIVLDPYAGSGVTILAAKQLNRGFIGIEYQEKYYNMIKERLEKNKNIEQKTL